MTDSSAGALDLHSAPYKPSAIIHGGSVAGRDRLDGPAPHDTIPNSKDERICGRSAARAVQTPTSGLGNAVVWIADVTSGKPLPLLRRFDIASEDCELDPRVQAAVVGSTFDVENDDRLLHRLVFLRAGTNDTLTVMPFFNSGQIVASERLAKLAGLVEVRCVQHPWTRAFIAIFDHPYFAITKPDGSFRIDSLAAGNYRVMVWHEGATAPVEQPVQVGAGGEAKIDVAIKLAAK